MATEDWTIDVTPSWWTDAIAGEQAAALESIFGRRSIYRGPGPVEFLVSESKISIPFAAGMEVDDIHPTADLWKQVLEAEGAFTRERLTVISAEREQLEALAIIHRISDVAEMSTELLRAHVALAMIYTQLNTQWRICRAELLKWSLDPDWGDNTIEALEADGRGGWWAPLGDGENSGAALGRVAELESFASEAAAVLSEFGNGTTDSDITDLRDLSFSAAPDWTSAHVPTRAELERQLSAARGEASFHKERTVFLESEMRAVFGDGERLQERAEKAEKETAYWNGNARLLFRALDGGGDLSDGQEAEIRDALARDDD